MAVLTEENPIDALNFANSIKAKAINPWFKTLTEHQVKQIKKEEEEYKELMDKINKFRTPFGWLNMIFMV